MLQFTGGYVDNYNFIIDNIKQNNVLKADEQAFICVLKNILFRGCPTNLSNRLYQEIGKISNSTDENALIATSVFMFQTMILSMIENGTISFKDRIWKFKILNDLNYEFVNLAIEDLFLWIQHLSKLQKLKIRKPRISIISVSSVELLKNKDFINIDFSITKKYSSDEQLLNDVIYVRINDSEKDYYQLSTAERIKYKIISDGKDSDISSMEFLLKNIFGFNSFRPGQLSIIVNALSGEDTLGILPTGSGKSLCYQFCALLQPCVSFIVCPIKSLMYDQFKGMNNIGIDRNNYISSDQDRVMKSTIMNDYVNNKYHFIWISPERFQNKEFVKNLYEINLKNKIGYAIIDEVHCLSEWGHDFRTSYLCLISTIRKICSETKLIGLTATASSYVLRDLKTEFDIDISNIKTLQKFSRDELVFSVTTVNGANFNAKKIALFDTINKINKYQNIFLNSSNAGLIFTLNVNGPFGCYEVSKEISYKYGVPPRWYAGGIPQYDKKPIMDYEEFNQYRIDTQERFKNDEYPILVSTKAFGMGIDKANIRYTIHYGMPVSVESLYQEAGRAGRDGNTAECHIIRSTEIVEKKLLNKLFARETSIEEIKRIQQLVGFKGNDVFSNFFLWLGHNKGVNSEYKIMSKVFNTYAKPDTTQWIYCSTLGDDLETVQKAIYRLNIIGIVDSWFIENWDVKNGILEVVFNNYSIESVKEKLKEYILKYDPDNSFEELFKDYAVIKNYEPYFMVLLDWTYDTIVYCRRQAIKTIYERCENFTTSEEFKNEIDNYFKYDNTTVIFDNIAFNKTDYHEWFKLFYLEHNFIQKKEFIELRGTIARYLESSKNNVGLNLISGIIRLFLDDYINEDGKNRLVAAFKIIRTYNDETKQSILNEMLKIAEQLKDSKNKNYLRRLLYKEYPNEKIKIKKYLPYSKKNDYNYTT